MLKKSYWSIPLLLLILNFNTAYASLEDDSNTIFNWAEQQFPEYFSPANQNTQKLDVWYYRFYSGTNTYIATNIINQVYVLGGDFGESPLLVSTVSELLEVIKSSSGTTSLGNNNCVNLPLPKEGLSVSYDVTNGSYTGTEDITYWGVNNTSIEINITSMVNGSITEISNQLTNYQIIDNFVYADTILSGFTMFTSGSASGSMKTTTTYSPSLITGPAFIYCEQQSWTTAPITSTTKFESDLLPGGQDISTNTEPVLSSIVEKVNVSFTNSAGTFSLVKIRQKKSSDSDNEAISWFSIEHGILVKEQIIDSSGKIIGSKELTSIQ